MRLRRSQSSGVGRFRWATCSNSIWNCCSATTTASIRWSFRGGQALGRSQYRDQNAERPGANRHRVVHLESVSDSSRRCSQRGEPRIRRRQRAKQQSVMFPSIGVTADGRGVLAFSLVGESYFPSAAYVPIDAVNGAGAIRIAAGGAAPDDGFTGYPIALGLRAGRWGDYSAAVADGDGNVWFAVEYIPELPRTVAANWGTLIGKVSF